MKAMMLPVLKSKEDEYQRNIQNSDSQISDVDSQLRQLSL